MSSVDSIDYSILEELKRLGKKSPDFLSDLLGPFLETSSKTISEMNLSLSQMAWEDLVSQSHRFRSTCGGLGASRMAELCGLIEKSAKTKNVEIAASSLQSLEQELIVVSKVLRQELLS